MNHQLTRGLALFLAFGPFVALRADLVGTLGGDVSVDNHGSANYSIPLPIPAGRSGMQPRLSLEYNSNAGNGPLGIGWSIGYGTSRITRGRSIRARDGYVHAPVMNEDDRLYLDGKRLVLVGSTGNYWAVGNQYRTEVDTFAKITALGDNGASTGSSIESFKLEAKDGTILYFGKIDASSADAVQRFNGTTGTYSWALKRMVDPIGNSLEFTYNIYQNASNQLTGEHLLAGIDYTANSSLSIAATKGVRFVYTPSAPKAVGGDAERPMFIPDISRLDQTKPGAD